ncbi:MAG: hypothetical protein AAGF84_11805 [Planctomycetota bacterium]
MSMMIRPRICVRSQALLGTTAAVGLLAGQATAINLVVDYTYDTQNFFGSGNPQGLAGGNQARASLEAAADFFSVLLEDSLSSIEVPDPYFSQSFDGQVTWSWERRITSPGTGSPLSFGGPIAQDEYVIYAGGRALSGSILGLGGPGGFSWSSNPSGGFTSQEINELNAITDAFGDAVETRGKASGFSSWGGVVTFDSDDTNWHFDHLSEPAFGESDFFSVAIHELGHAVGFGTADEWDALVNGGTFFGAASFAENGNVYPALSSDRAHWLEDTMSSVRGTGVAQETSMDPDLTIGTRKLWTDLDTAGLEDIGWEIAALVVAGLAGDFDGDGFVAQGDLNLVLGNWGSPRGAWDNAEGLDTQSVDQEELNRVLTNWGSTSSPSFTGFAVPEPIGAGLALTLMGLTSLRRR